MGRCNYDALLNKIGINKLTKQTEVSFTVMKDLPDCRRIDAKNYIREIGVDGYNKYKRPDNKFECMRGGCVNTGSLMVSAVTEGDDTKWEVVYHIPYDATEFANGVITFYIGVDDGATPPDDVTVLISNDDTFANADSYNAVFPGIGEDGFAPIYVDLTWTPNTVGDGWEPSPSGAYIKITSDSVDTLLSSIAVFDSIFDFETNDVVKVGCLSSIGGTNDIGTLEATCLSAGYDDTVNSIDYTITGNTVTPNYWKLNPLMGKGKAVEGFVPVNVEKTVAEYNPIEGVRFGVVYLPDAAPDECGFYGVQIKDSCDITGATLTQLSIPGDPSPVDAGHFVVVHDDGSIIFLSEDLIGMKVIVAYPQKADVEEYVASVDNIGSVRVRMAYEVSKTDGTREVHVFDNVLITSFPATIGTDETEFSFTVSIQKMANGQFYRVYRILN